MKTLIKINKVTFFTALILMVTFYGGPIGLLFLGFVQIVSAIYLSYSFYNKSIKAKRYLTVYWGLAFIELLILFWIFKSKFILIHFELFYAITLITPWIAATYFYIILNKIVTENENFNEPHITL